MEAKYIKELLINTIRELGTWELNIKIYSVYKISYSFFDTAKSPTTLYHYFGM